MSIRFDGSFTYETTALPCPSWCDQPPGHEMSHIVEGVDRLHTLTIGASGLGVELTTYEAASSTAGPVTATEHTMTLMSGIEDKNLTSADARRLAAALLNAADKRDELDANGWA